MKELSIDCNYGTIKGLCWGLGNEKKILALHGWLDNAASFYQLAPMLAERGYEVLAIDFAGHGHSDHRAKGHFNHFIDYVLDVQNVLKVMQWDEPILLGHSMGAAMAQMYAAANPNTVQKLIMIENLGPVPAYEKGSAAQNLSVALQQWKNHSSEHKNYYPDIQSALQARKLVTPMAEHILEPMVVRGIKSTPKGYHWRTDKRLRLRSLFRFSEETVQDMLAAEKPPTQIILAEPVTYALKYPSADQRLQKLAADECVSIKGHHHLHMDNAEAVYEAIIKFLENNLDEQDNKLDDKEHNKSSQDKNDVNEFNVLTDQ